MEKFSKESMVAFIEKFSKSIDSEYIGYYKKIIGNGKIETCEGPEEFYSMVTYPFKKFINGYLKTVSCETSLPEDFEFLYENYRFVVQHYEFIIEKHEGSPCSADKSSALIRALTGFFVTGSEINFYYNQKYTYHLPNKVFKTHDRIVGFYKGLKSLWNGNPAEYLNQMTHIISDMGGLDGSNKSVA